MAFGHLAWDDHGAVFAAFEDEAREADVETAFGFTFFTVALKAVRFQDGPHVFFKHHGCRRSAERRGCQQHEGEV